MNISKIVDSVLFAMGVACLVYINANFASKALIVSCVIEVLSTVRAIWRYENDL